MAKTNTNIDYAALRNDITEALKAVGEKYGVSMKATNLKYSDFDFDVKVEGIIKNDNVDGKKELFDKYCVLYDFVPEDYNRELVLQGETFRLVGFNTRRPKNCCEVVNSKGKSFVCSKETVQRCFK